MIDRRAVIVNASGLLGATALLGSMPFLARRFTAASGGKAIMVGGGRRRDGAAVVVASWNQDLVVEEIYTVPFEVHSAIIVPSGQILALPKNEPVASVVTLGSRHSAIPVTAIAGHAFSGHGVLDAVRGVILTSEYRLGGYAGSIVVRDLNTLRVVDVIPSGGLYPHELAFSNGRRNLLIANGAGASNLATVDISTKKLVRRAEISRRQPDSSPDGGVKIRHFFHSDSGQLALATLDESPELRNGGGRVYIGHEDRDGLVELNVPSHTLQDKRPVQFLSVHLDEQSSLVCATAPSIGAVLLWDASSGGFRRAVLIDKPSGVTMTPDRRFFVVNTAAGNLLQISTHTLDAQRVEGKGLALLQSSHLSVGYLANNERII